MRKLVLISFLTLDGVMQAPGGQTEDIEGGFEHGGWQFSYEGDGTVMDEIDKAGALLLGRKTYDIFSNYWPTEGKDVPKFGPLMNSLPKYVVSNSLSKVDWQNSHLIKGDVAGSIQKIKAEAGKDIYIFGSGNLCQTLMRHNLIDEYLLMIHPLVLGSGKHLFKEGLPKKRLKVVNSKITQDGIIVVRYQSETRPIS